MVIPQIPLKPLYDSTTFHKLIETIIFREIITETISLRCSLEVYIYNFLWMVHVQLIQVKAIILKSFQNLFLTFFTPLITEKLG